MNAIILAAGLGTRLKPITDKVPKCMVEVNGMKIIEKQINNLNKNEVEDILVITGYKNDIIKSFLFENFKYVKCIENSIYYKTNNMYSLYLAREYLYEKDFILMNADVFFDGKVIRDLMHSRERNLIVCEKGSYLEESMKIEKNEEKVTNIDKGIKKNNAYGVSIDIYKFSKQASKKLFDIICRIIEVEKEQNAWTEVALKELLNIEIFNSLDMKCKWVEIDNHDDLKLAEATF